MPVPNQDQIIATTWEAVIGKKPNDNIFTSRALFNALGEKGFKEEANGGRLIEFPLEYAENSTFKSYDELEQLDTTRVNVFDCARYDWKIHAGTVVFSDLEKLRAQGDASKIGSYVEEKLNNARDSHTADLNRAAFLDGTGNGSKNIDGLTKIIPEAPTSGTVGQINRATFSFWRSQATTGSGTNFSILRASMRSTYNKCSNGGVEFAPTAAITSRTVFEGYEGLLTTLERYNKDDGNRGASQDWDGKKLQYKGIPVFYDEDCSPADQLYFVNPKFLKFVYLKNGWMKMKEPVEPANQLSQVYRLFTVANMGTNNSRRLGCVFDIA